MRSYLTQSFWGKCILTLGISATCNAFTAGIYKLTVGNQQLPAEQITHKTADFSTFFMDALLYSTIPAKIATIANNVAIHKITTDIYVQYLSSVTMSVFTEIMITGICCCRLNKVIEGERDDMLAFLLITGNTMLQTAAAMYIWSAEEELELPTIDDSFISLEDL